MNIYQIWDETDENGASLLGTFLDKEEAIKRATELDPSCEMEGVCNSNYAKARVEEVEIGMTGFGITILKLEWTEKYQPETDDYEWELKNEN